MRRIIRNNTNQFLRKISNNSKDIIQSYNKERERIAESLRNKDYEERKNEFKNLIYPDRAEFPKDAIIYDTQGNLFNQEFKKSNLFFIISTRSSAIESVKWIEEINKSIESPNHQNYFLFVYEYHLLFKFFKNMILNKLKQEYHEYKSLNILASSKKNFPFGYAKKYPSIVLFDESKILKSRLYGEVKETELSKLIKNIKSLNK